MEKEALLKSYQTKQKVFLILGIVFIALMIIPIILTSYYEYRFMLELIQDHGYTFEYILEHIFEIIGRFYEGMFWLEIIMFLFSLLADVGIAFIILSFVLFGRRARNIRREIENEKKELETKE